MVGGGEGLMGKLANSTSGRGGVGKTYRGGQTQVHDLKVGNLHLRTGP